MAQNDSDLIDRCRRGDDRAWNTLVDRYGRLVYSIPHRYGLRESDADDVFASVWSIAFRKLEELKDHSRLSSWLITTTHRECWRLGRKKGYAELNDSIQDVSEPAAHDAERWERQHLVRRGLQELGGKCKDLLEALFLDQTASYDDVARRVGIPVGSIGPTRARCFEKLQHILESLGLGPGEDLNR